MVQAGLEIFRAHGKEGLVPVYLMNVGWCIKIRNVHAPPECNQIDVSRFLISRSPRSSVGRDILSVSSTSALRTTLGRFVVHRGLAQMGRELWRDGLEAQI